MLAGNKAELALALADTVDQYRNTNKQTNDVMALERV